MQKQIEILEKYQNVSFVHTGFQFLIEPENVLGKKMESWTWNMPDGRIDRLVSFLNHEFTLYPCASTSCFRVKPFVDCYVAHPQLLDYGIGEGTLLHTSMCMYGGEYVFLPDVTTVYRHRSDSLSHFKDISDQIIFQLKYLKLKIVVFKMFCVPESKYCHVVNADLEKNFIMAYSSRNLNALKYTIKEIGLDSSTLQSYEYILSSRLKRFIFFWFLRIKNKIKRYLRYDKYKKRI